MFLCQAGGAGVAECEGGVLIGGLEGEEGGGEDGGEVRGVVVGRIDEMRGDGVAVRVGVRRGVAVVREGGVEWPARFGLPAGGLLVQAVESTSADAPATSHRRWWLVAGVKRKLMRQ